MPLSPQHGREKSAQAEDAAVRRLSPRVLRVLGHNPGLFTALGTNTYIVGTGRRRILVDAGQGLSAHLDGLAEALAGQLPDATIVDVVLTHGHHDHAGGVDALRRRFGIERVWKLPGVPAHAPPNLEDGLGELVDGAELHVEGATLRVLATPGHAVDHACLRLLEENALFSGDNVLGWGSTVIPADGDLATYCASLHRMLGEDSGRAYPGHGRLVADAHQRIGTLLAHRAQRDAQILTQLQQRPATLETLVATIYEPVPRSLHRAAAISLEAHLRSFERQGRVRCEASLWHLIER